MIVRIHCASDRLRALVRPKALSACVTLALACSSQRLDVVECADACGGTPSEEGGAPAGGMATAGEATTGGLGGSGGQGAAGTAGTSSLFAESLIHRYDFEGTGTTAFDRVGGAHGTLIGTELTTIDGRGVVVLAGGYSGQYIELPRGIVSKLDNATFEAWVTWNGQRVWERVFDFGDAIIGEDGRWYGSSYLFLTPQTPPSIGQVLRVGQQRTNEREISFDAPIALPADVRTHVALVVNNERRVFELFVDGAFVTSRAILRMDQPFHALATLNDENNWLGRSQFEQDAFFGGIFHEFRIYGAALTAAEIATSYARGPDP